MNSLIVTGIVTGLETVIVVGKSNCNSHDSSSNKKTMPTFMVIACNVHTTIKMLKAAATQKPPWSTSQKG